MNTKDEKRVAAGLNVLEAAKIAGVGRSTIYQELASGRLSARKLGRRTIIPEHALRDWMDGLPAYRSRTTQRLDSNRARADALSQDGVRNERLSS